MLAVQGMKARKGNSQFSMNTIPPILSISDQMMVEPCHGPHLGRIQDTEPLRLVCDEADLHHAP